MTKKEPTELSVEEKLNALYQLQTTLSAIDEKRALRGELPLEVQDLEDEIAGLNRTTLPTFSRPLPRNATRLKLPNRAWSATNRSSTRCATTANTTR